MEWIIEMSLGDQLAEALFARFQLALPSLARTIEAELKAEAPVGPERPHDSEHIHIKDAIKAEPKPTRDGGSIVVRVPVNHAGIIEQGTGERRIYPNRSNVMHWQTPFGDDVYAHSVSGSNMHKGWFSSRVEERAWVENHLAPVFNSFFGSGKIG